LATDADLPPERASSVRILQQSQMRRVKHPATMPVLRMPIV